MKGVISTFSMTYTICRELSPHSLSYTLYVGSHLHILYIIHYIQGVVSTFSIPHTLNVGVVPALNSPVSERMIQLASV